METLSLKLKPIQTVKICTKEECLQAFCHGNKVAIGYSNKKDGAFWSSEQFKSQMLDCWTNDFKFEYMVKQVKQYIPHTRIKYGLYIAIE